MEKIGYNLALNLARKRWQAATMSFAVKVLATLNDVPLNCYLLIAS